MGAAATLRFFFQVSGTTAMYTRGDTCAVPKGAPLKPVVVLRTTEENCLKHSFSGTSGVKPPASQSHA